MTRPDASAVATYVGDLMPGSSGQHPQELSIGHAEERHYVDLIRAANVALEQVRSMARGEAQQECAVCGDGGHTVERCHHNPLLLAAIGGDAILGSVFRCFHCGAVFCDEQSAEGHFGRSRDEVVRCVADRVTLTRDDRKLISRWKAQIRADRKMGTDPDDASYEQGMLMLLSRRQLARVVTLITGKEVKP